MGAFSFGGYVVTETVPVEATPQEEANLAPQEAPQTEAQEGAVAAPEEAVASEPETETHVNDEPPTVPPERTYTEAELREQARILAQQEREAEQQRNRAEAGRRAWQEQQAAKERSRRKQVVEIAVARGDDPEAIVQMLDDWDDTRQSQWLDHSQTLATQALGALAEQIEGRQPVISDPRVQKVYDTLEPAMNLAFQAGQQAAMQDAIPKSELDKYVNAEIARRNQKAREGQKPIQRTEGTPSASSVMSWADYSRLSEAEQLAMPETERRAIFAADAKARSERK